MPQKVHEARSGLRGEAGWGAVFLSAAWKGALFVGLLGWWVWEASRTGPQTWEGHITVSHTKNRFMVEEDM